MIIRVLLQVCLLPRIRNLRDISESPEILPQELPVTGVSIYLNLVTLLSHEEVMLHVQV